MTIQNRFYQSQIHGLQEDTKKDEAVSINEAQVDIPNLPITDPSGINMQDWINNFKDRFRPLYRGPGSTPIEPTEPPPLTPEEEMLQQQEEDLKEIIRKLQRELERERLRKPQTPAEEPMDPYKPQI